MQPIAAKGQENFDSPDSVRDLLELREQHRATIEILSVISRFPTDVQPVFDAIVTNAARLCDAAFSALARYDHNQLHLVAVSRMSDEEAAAYRSIFPRAPSPDFVMGRAFVQGRPVHVEDIDNDPDYDPRTRSILKAAGAYRTFAGIPILKDGLPVGVIGCGRRDVRPFSAAQIALVQTFADQAVIAIENTRLFNEAETRNRELRVALDQQAGASELLKVIGSSACHLQPVFDKLAEFAVRLSDSERAFILRYDGSVLRVVAAHNVLPEMRNFIEQNPIAPGRDSGAGRAVLERRTIHICDVKEDPEYTYYGGLSVPLRSVLAVPMMRDGTVLGVIAINRHEVNPFTDNQISLIETFANQAVIAIENARLFEEVQAQRQELSRSVDELRALGEVTRAVLSTLDLETVLHRILHHACQLSETGGGAIYVFDKAHGHFQLAAGKNMSEQLIAAVRKRPIRLGESLVGQVAVRREAIAIEDLAEAPAHPLYSMHLEAGMRALLAVPLLYQDEVVGALVVRRRQPGRFATSVIELVQTFANQSAIAVHNARLFQAIEEQSRELERASLHKSQFVANMSHELRTPLAAVLGYAELLREGIYGTLPQKSLPILERILSNGKHLLSLINTVLDIAKIESGQFKLNLADYAPSSMIETVRAATESLATAKHIALRTEIANPLPSGFGDEPRLTQVLLNLVGNAIKFTDVGEVRIAAASAEGRFTFSVSDTGPGIPPLECERIFEKFHQVDNSNTRRKGGTGLGLAIAKEIVGMHGGRIWVESTVGKGSKFLLELPVRTLEAGGPP